MFYEERGLAMCGLACVLCSQETCPGCLKDGCENRATCDIYQCASGKGLAGCYLCDAFPCEKSMFQSKRVCAFNRYAKEFGVRALMKRLKENAQNGIIYHQPGSLLGDYDAPETEDGIMQFIQFGRNNPYATCPVFETAHFTIRLVAEADAEDLLACYGDLRARRLFNTDNCPPGQFDHPEWVRELVRGWIERDYANGNFIRFAVVDRQTQKAVGTIEIYDRKCQQSDRTTGILRIDLAPAYEKKALLSELLDVSCNIFFNIFHTETILHQAIPDAADRIAALRAGGFAPIEIEGREHYYARWQ